MLCPTRLQGPAQVALDPPCSSLVRPILPAIPRSNFHSSMLSHSFILNMGICLPEVSVPIKTILLQGNQVQSTFTRLR